MTLEQVMKARDEQDRRIARGKAEYKAFVEHLGPITNLTIRLLLLPYMVPMSADEPND